MLKVNGAQERQRQSRKRSDQEINPQIFTACLRHALHQTEPTKNTHDVILVIKGWPGRSSLKGCKEFLILKNKNTDEYGLL